jgi:hypothetical protein
MGLSIRAYARYRGVSHVAVKKAIDTGRITPLPDGTIDPIAGDAQWAANTTPSRRSVTATEPAKIDDRLVHLLHSQENAHQTQPQRLFAKGERVMIVDGAFAGLEAMY